MRNPVLALCFLFATVIVATASRAEQIDNCASVLGSLAVELRIARDLPPGRRTSYSCAKRYTPLIGASRDRVLRSLGTPDRTGEDGGWSYYFGSRHGQREPGTPQLDFHFDEAGLVATVDCQRMA